MLDSGLLSKNFIGRDGFIWWIGQVPDAKYWKGNLPTLPQDSPADLPGFKYRVKVRVLGYHTADLNNLPDDDLPWALVMLPTTAGSGSGGNAITPRFSGGEFVFGFFLDGDNGQQPVIIGMLGNSTQTLLSKSIPSVGFKARSGYSSSEKVIPYHALRSTKGIESSRTQDNGSQSPTGSQGGQPEVTVGTTSPDSSQSATQEGSNSTGDLKTAHQERQQEDNKNFPLANACKKNKKKTDGIKKAIKNLIKFIRKIQKFNNKYISPALNTAQNLSKEISKCAGLISGYIKDILTDFRSFINKEINDKTKKLEAALSIRKQIVAGEIKQKSVDTIGCIFNKIIESLVDLVEAFLNKSLDKLFSVTDCVIDSLLGSLLNSILGPLEGAISSALGPISNLISQASGLLSTGLSYATMLQNFLSCEEEDQCPEVESWSWLDGPTKEDDDNFERTLAGISTFASGSLSNFLGNPSSGTISGGELSACFSGPATCGPPSIDIFGGGGSGVLANPIIGDNGEILAVDLLSSGIDYYSNPFVYFNDECGNGSGAVAEVVVGSDNSGDCGKIIDIKVVNGGSGYLKRSNGSIGSNGSTLVGVGSDSKAMVLPQGADYSISSSNFDFSSLAGILTTSSLGISTTILTGPEVSCGIVTAYPSIPVFVNQGSNVTIPPGGSLVLSPSMGALSDIPNDSIISGNTYTFPSGSTVTIPLATDDQTTNVASSTILDYNVVLEISEIIVKNTGVNYSLDDKICVTPDNGAELVPQYDPFGRLVSVKILNKGDYVTSRPTISICDSATGVNAEMFAVLNPIRVTQEQAETLGLDPQKLVSVIDCVGKVNV